MKNQERNSSVIVPAILNALFVLTEPAFPQGSLTPPGPPAPMMKTLDQIEARSCSRLRGSGQGKRPIASLRNDGSFERFGLSLMFGIVIAVVAYGYAKFALFLF